MRRRVLRALLWLGLALVTTALVLVWQAPALLAPRTPLPSRPLTPAVAAEVAKRTRSAGLALALGRQASVTLTEDEWNRFLSQGAAHNPTVTALATNLEHGVIGLTIHLLLPDDVALPHLRGKPVEVRLRAVPTVDDTELVLKLTAIRLGALPVPVGLFMRIAPLTGIAARFNTADQTIAISIPALLNAAGGSALSAYPIDLTGLDVTPGFITFTLTPRS
jgi:hypothetical protein